MSSKRFKKRYIVGALALIIGIAGYKMLSPKSSISYLTTPAQIMDLEVNILADGKMEASHQVDVGAQVSGQVQKMHVKLGDRVKKGQLIVEIDDLPQQNAVKDSEARLKNSIASKVAKEAQLINQRINVERQRRLIKNGATTQSELDLAEANLKVYEAEVEALDAQIAQAQIALDTAKLNLTYTKILAPIDGVVVATVVKEGQTVNAVQTAPTLVKLADLSTMTIKAQISEADVTRVEPGMKAYFTILGEPHKRYEAVLRQIEPATETFQTAVGNAVTNVNEAVYYNGLFDVENPDQKFYIDMTTQVYLVIDEAKDALVIPSMATRFKPSRASERDLQKSKGQSDQKATIWVLKDPKGEAIEAREVELGISNNVSTEVKSGVKEGELIITSELEMSNKRSAPTMSRPPGVGRRG